MEKFHKKYQITSMSNHYVPPITIKEPDKSGPDSYKIIELLSELALDMRWSWIRSGDDIWRHLDPVL
jgi:hypothetical protein